MGGTSAVSPQEIFANFANPLSVEVWNSPRNLEYFICLNSVSACLHVPTPPSTRRFPKARPRFTARLYDSIQCRAISLYSSAVFGGGGNQQRGGRPMGIRSLEPERCY